MRQLLPAPADDVDGAARYLADRREPAGERPWVVVNMATTVDGATALAGRSGGIGGPGDRAVFHALRSAADIILVGAGTVRAEHYGPVHVPDEHLATRAAHGRTSPARIAVVTATCSLDPSARLFSDPAQRPLIYTTEAAPPERVASLAEVADVARVGSSTVDLDATLADLGARGARCVVCEGGPSLNGQLIAAEVIDEWCVTIGPVLAGGPSARAAHGDRIPEGLPLHLDRLLIDGQELLARYLMIR